MRHEVKQVRKDTWIIEEAGVRYFLLAGQAQAALIDTGMDSPDARSIAEELTERPVILLNTHADPDHVSGNAGFPEVWMSASECAFYHHRKEGRAGDGGNITVPAANLLQVRPLYEGDIIDLGGRELEVIALPGHTPGSIAFLDRKYRVLISGDSIQHNGRIYLFGPQRDLMAYADSLRRLQARLLECREFDKIWPSHAELPLSPDALGPVIFDAEAALAGELQGEEIEVHGMRARALRGTYNILLSDG